MINVAGRQGEATGTPKPLGRYERDREPWHQREQGPKEADGNMLGGGATGCTTDQEADDAPGEIVGDLISADAGIGDAEEDAGRTGFSCGL